MQQRPENDLVYLLTILEAAGKIKLYCGNFKNPQEFYEANDQLNYNGSLLLIATIGDHVSKLSEVTKDHYSIFPGCK